MGGKKKKKKNTTHDTHSTSSTRLLQKNKKAYFEYEVLETFECGIVLLGSEVKSIKMNKFHFSDSFARIKHNTLCLHNMHVSSYTYYTETPLDELRIRTLLVHKKELKKIKRHIEEKGHTLIPLSLYLKHGLIKMELGICRGKKLYNKKESIKQKTIDRDAQRMVKEYFKQ